VIVTSDHETVGHALIDGDENLGTTVSAFSSDLHTAAMVPLFANGPGAAAFSGVYNNTELFDKFLAYYNLAQK
jgi:alkaline phosphatase